MWPVREFSILLRKRMQITQVWTSLYTQFEKAESRNLVERFPAGARIKSGVDGLVTANGVRYVVAVAVRDASVAKVKVRNVTVDAEWRSCLM